MSTTHTQILSMRLPVPCSAHGSLRIALQQVHVLLSGLTQLPFYLGFCQGCPTMPQICKSPYGIRYVPCIARYPLWKTYKPCRAHLQGYGGPTSALGTFDRAARARGQTSSLAILGLLKSMLHCPSFFLPGVSKQRLVCRGPHDVALNLSTLLIHIAHGPPSRC